VSQGQLPLPDSLSALVHLVHIISERFGFIININIITTSTIIIILAALVPPTHFFQLLVLVLEWGTPAQRQLMIKITLLYYHLPVEVTFNMFNIFFIISQCLIFQGSFAQYAS
jgi:hypothetical protein